MEQLKNSRKLPRSLSHSLFAVMVLGAPLEVWAFIHFFGWNSGLAVGVVVLAHALVLIGLERAFPLHASWQPSAPVVRVDLLHSLISTPLPPALIASFAVGLFQEFNVQLSASLGVTQIWPKDWPLALQVGLGLLMSEFGAYWIHRTCHMNRFFWRIHALHHSPRLLHTLASGRNHPFNVIAIYSARVLPLVALGVGPEMLACISVVNGVHGMLQHVNLDLRAGWLNYVFAGPELHHRHHSLVLADSRTNFGNILIFWDLVFGTFKLLKDERMDDGVGVHELAVPEAYSAQILLPFTLSRWESPELAKRGLSLTDSPQSA